MKKFPLCLIICIFWLASCGSASIVSLHSTQGFTVSYPNNFKAGTDTSNGISLTDKTTGAIIVINKTAIVTPKTDSEIIQWYNSKSPIDESGDIVANGKKWSYVEFTNRYAKLAMYHRDSWIQDWGSLYAVGCTAKEEKKTEVQKICSDIAISLKIVP